jgi:hypothetical protein
MTVEAITHEPGGPGRIFLLDEESVAEKLISAADRTRGAIRWDESSGMRQVYAHDLHAMDEFELLRGLYRGARITRAA